jgi:hypothetical protein
VSKCASRINPADWLIFNPWAGRRAIDTLTGVGESCRLPQTGIIASNRHLPSTGYLRWAFAFGPNGPQSRGGRFFRNLMTVNRRCRFYYRLR